MDLVVTPEEGQKKERRILAQIKAKLVAKIQEHLWKWRLTSIIDGYKTRIFPLQIMYGYVTT